jgi:hypothetical protein
MRTSEEFGVEHIGYHNIGAEFGSASGYGIRQPAGHICSADSFEFRSLSVAAFKVCHVVASQLEETDYERHCTAKCRIFDPNIFEHL